MLEGSPAGGRNAVYLTRGGECDSAGGKEPEKVEVKEAESSSSSSSKSSSESESKEKSTPVNDVIISKVSVETYGVDYGKPDTLETWNYYDWVYKTYGINLKQYQQ